MECNPCSSYRSRHKGETRPAHLWPKNKKRGGSKGGEQARAGAGGGGGWQISAVWGRQAGRQAQQSIACPILHRMGHTFPTQAPRHCLSPLILRLQAGTQATPRPTTPASRAGAGRGPAAPAACRAATGAAPRAPQHARELQVLQGLGGAAGAAGGAPSSARPAASQTCPTHSSSWSLFCCVTSLLGLQQ